MSIKYWSIAQLSFLYNILLNSLIARVWDLRDGGCGCLLPEHGCRNGLPGRSTRYWRLSVNTTASTKLAELRYDELGWAIHAQTILVLVTVEIEWIFL